MAKNKLKIEKIKPEDIKLEVNPKKETPQKKAVEQKREEPNQEEVSTFQSFVDSASSKLNVENLFLSSGQRAETIDDTVASTPSTTPEPVQNVSYTAGGQKYTNIEKETRPGYGETETRAGYPKVREFSELREAMNQGNTLGRSRIPFTDQGLRDENVPTNQFEEFAQEQQKYQETQEQDSRLPFQRGRGRRTNM